jgi:hypothetical protein
MKVLDDSFHVQREQCANPWNGKCGSTDITVYISLNEDYLPICRSCWNKIADKDFEWGEEHSF